MYAPTKKHKRYISKAHQILDGIPEKKIDLDAWLVKKGKTLSCGTIACGGGWLGLHPFFNRAGFKLNKESGSLVYTSKNLDSGFDGSSDVLNDVFGRNASAYLFASRGSGGWDREILSTNRHMSDKELLLARLKKAYRLPTAPE